MPDPSLRVDNIQGDILGGLVKQCERLVFFTISDVTAFRALLRDLDVTNTTQVLALKAVIDERKKNKVPGLVASPGLNVAFTWSGLRALGLVDGTPPADKELQRLKAGMAGSRDRLADPVADDWDVLGPTQRPDGVFIVTGSSHSEIANLIALRLGPASGNGFVVIHEEAGQVRPAPVEGHEHFGYADGVSQPGVRGEVAPGVPLTPRADPLNPNQGQVGQDLLWPGEFVYGYSGQTFDRNTPDDFTVEGPDVVPPVDFMRDGAYLVFRRLRQFVPEFDLAVKEAAKDADTDVEPLSAELLGAQLVGRWKSGAPLEVTPTNDDPKIAEDTPLVNDFDFKNDRGGLRCPWAAHIRKMYPRDDVLDNTAPDPSRVDKAEAFTQTHRMLRRGITFGPELTENEALDGRSDPAQQRGLLFKCYVTSLDEQFEFVQENWANADDFVQAGAGRDALIGQPNEAGPFLGAAPHSGDAANKPSLTFRRFIHMQGGEYFFAPSLSALKEL